MTDHCSLAVGWATALECFLGRLQTHTRTHTTVYIYDFDLYSEKKKTLEFLWLELLHSAVQPFLAIVQTNSHLFILNKLESLDCRKRHNKHQFSHQQVELFSLVRKYCEKGRSLVLG